MCSSICTYVALISSWILLSHLQDFMKQNAAMLVMPVWSKPELDLCRERLCTTLNKERMDGLYNKYSGVPRNVLEWPSVNPEVLDL